MTIPPRLFNLEGTLIGFVGSDPRQPKSIALEVEQEQLTVKLPKELRPRIQSYLQPGDRVRCIGNTQVDLKAGLIKLKAYQVFASQPQPQASNQRAQAAAHPNLPTPPTPTPTPTPEAAKILICHKSGCQKRGGRQLAVALEQALVTYRLQDQVEIQYTGCQKRCSKAPSLTVLPGKHRYDKLKTHNVTALIEEHFCTS